MLTVMWVKVRMCRNVCELACGRGEIFFLLFRPCAFFSMFLVTFFSTNLRGRAEKKQNVQRKKKRTGSVFQTT